MTIIVSYHHIIISPQPQGASHFRSKVKVKNTKSVFYPFAKDRREKINELQALTFDEESAYDAQKIVAPPKHLFIEFTPNFFSGKNHHKLVLGVEK